MSNRIPNRTRSPLRKLLPALLVSLSIVPPAFAVQDPAPVRKAIEDFLRVQTAGLPGEASFNIGAIDPRNQLTPCPALEVSLPAGARAWGRGNVQVRCQIEGGWKIFVPVQVRVVGDYLVAARPLSQGAIVGGSDLTTGRGDLAELPDGLLTAPEQAIGRSLAQSLPTGRPLRGDMLRQPLAVQQGQSVKVFSKGPGFQVTAGDGRALNNAIDGQAVQVRMPNGHIVGGIARSGGSVEVSY